MKDNSPNNNKITQTTSYTGISSANVTSWQGVISIAPSFLIQSSADLKCLHTVIPRDELKSLIAIAHRDERNSSNIEAGFQRNPFKKNTSILPNGSEKPAFDISQVNPECKKRKNISILPNGSEKPAFDISQVNPECKKRKNIIVFREDNNAELKRQKTSSWQDKITQKPNNPPAFSRGQ